MKVSAQKISSHPKYIKALEWGKLITITGSAQVVVQVLGLISGIIIIRLLSTQEYALYTLANTMLGTMTLLSDGGISTGVMAEGGKVWNHPQQLGSVMVTGMHLRKKFAIVSLIISVPILVILLLHHGASWITTICIIVCLIPAFIAALSDTILEVAPKLRQDIIALQKNQVAANVARFGLICISIFIFPFAYIAIAAAGLSRIWGNVRLKKISAFYTDFSQPHNADIQRKILEIVKRILPLSIYYSISSQIIFWIISIFGSTTSIAQVGALSRLGMLITIFTAIFSILIIPRFARLENTRKKLFSHFFKIIFWLFALCVLFVSIIKTYPSSFLFLLGNNYLGLEIELVLTTIGACLALLSGVCYTLYTVKGWVISPFIAVPINIIVIIAGIMVFNISKLDGVLHLNILIASTQIVMNILFFLFNVRLLK